MLTIHLGIILGCTIEYLSFLVGNNYKSFCRKTFCSAMFIDVLGTYDLVYIPVLIETLKKMDILS